MVDEFMQLHERRSSTFRELDRIIDNQREIYGSNNSSDSSDGHDDERIAMNRTFTNMELLKKHMEGLMEKDLDLMRQLMTLQRSIDEMRREGSGFDAFDDEDGQQPPFANTSRSPSINSLAESDQPSDSEGSRNLKTHSSEMPQTSSKCLEDLTVTLTLSEDENGEQSQNVSPRENGLKINPKQYFSRRNSVLRIPIPPARSHHGCRVMTRRYTEGTGTMSSSTTSSSIPTDITSSTVTMSSGIESCIDSGSITNIRQTQSERRLRFKKIPSREDRSQTCPVIPPAFPEEDPVLSSANSSIQNVTCNEHTDFKPKHAAVEHLSAVLRKAPQHKSALVTIVNTQVSSKCEAVIKLPSGPLSPPLPSHGPPKLDPISLPRSVVASNIVWPNGCHRSDGSIDSGIHSPQSEEDGTEIVYV